MRSRRGVGLHLADETALWLLLQSGFHFASNFPLLPPAVWISARELLLRYKEIQSSRLFDFLVTTHREMQACTGGNREENLTSLIADIVAKLPESISFENAANGIFHPRENWQTGVNELSPLDTFLKGEVLAFNALLAYIRTSLTQLQAVSSPTAVSKRHAKRIDLDDDERALPASRGHFAHGHEDRQPLLSSKAAHVAQRSYCTLLQQCKVVSGTARLERNDRSYGLPEQSPILPGRSNGLDGGLVSFTPQPGAVATRSRKAYY